MHTRALPEMPAWKSSARWRQRSKNLHSGALSRAPWSRARPLWPGRDRQRDRFVITLRRARWRWQSDFRYGQDSAEGQHTPATMLMLAQIAIFSPGTFGRVLKRLASHQRCLSRISSSGS